MITQTFETMLYCPESDLTEFPSPESLKYRIMISTKPPKEYLEVRSKDASEDESSPKEDSDVVSRNLLCYLNSRVSVRLGYAYTNTDLNLDNEKTLDNMNGIAE